MNEAKIPLTPAEQMERIRATVYDTESFTQAPLAILASLFARSSALQQRIQNLESNMLLKEPPAGSRVPLIGPLLHWLRAFLIRVFMRWYVVPMMTQQNQFNMATTQAVRELAAATDGLASSLKEMNNRLSKLEGDSSSSSDS